ncbi:Hamartin protein-domain-containing protein [Phycomyces nitens]|nr:Hamartin protein-domain-containing protein [Phycomyces nitens]
MGLKEIARSASQSIKNATADSDGQATLDVIEKYLDEQTSSGTDNPAQSPGDNAIDKLSTELIALFGQTAIPLKDAAAVSSSPEAVLTHNQHYLILCFVHHLLPILKSPRIFQDWWDPVLKPILTTAPYTDQIKKEAREIVSDCLIVEQQQCRKNPLAEPKYCRFIVDQYLAWAESYHEREEINLEELEKSTGINETDRMKMQHQALLDLEQDEWSKNLKVILLTLGADQPKPFFMLLNEYFLSSKHRLQIVYLLSEFMLRKRTHLHEILETPLFNSMLQSLMYDNSTTLIAISVTNMIMLLPRICTSLPPFLPKLFYIFARALCWDQLRDMRKNKSPKGYTSEDRSTSQQEHDNWDCVDYTFSKLSAPPSNPQTGPFFTSLYGLYPCNFLCFLHKPYGYFKTNDFNLPEEFDEETFRTRTMLQVTRHMLHPNLVSMDPETELTDRSRWMKMEPPDVIAQIMSLDLTNAASRVAFSAGNERVNYQPQDLLDETLWAQTGKLTRLSKDEAIPEEKEKEEEVEKNESDVETLEHTPEEENTEEINAEKVNGDSQDETPNTEEEEEEEEDGAIKLNPTQNIKPKPMISNIIQVHRALKSGVEVLVGDDIWDAGLERLSSPPLSGVNTPRLEDHAVSTNTTNSEISKEAPKNLPETRHLVAALKREVLLLRNELNFELFLKQQHLQHIGRLHREHVLDSSVEAERQQLYNTTRMLKAQLKQTTDTLEKLKMESAMTKQKHIKWEDEQSGKLRGYREMRKDWQHQADAAQLQLTEYERLLAEQKTQLEEARQKAFDLENELSIIQPELERMSEYEHRVEQLTQQMLLWEEDTADLKKQKQYIDQLLSQSWSMEELVASLQAENRELEGKKSQREEEINTLGRKIKEYQMKLKTNVSIDDKSERVSHKREIDELYTAMRALQERVQTLEVRSI